MTSNNIKTAIGEGYIFGKPKNGTTPFLIKPRIQRELSDPIYYQPEHIVLEEKPVKEFVKSAELKKVPNPKAIQLGLPVETANYFTLKAS